MMPPSTNLKNYLSKTGVLLSSVFVGAKFAKESISLINIAEPSFLLESPSPTSKILSYSKRRTTILNYQNKES